MLVGSRGTKRYVSSILAAALFCLASPVFAQSDEPAKVELFGGYSFFHPNGRYVSPSTDPDKVRDMHGFGIAAAHPFKKYFTIAADFSRQESHGNSRLGFLVGPQARYKIDHAQPFIEGMVGVAHSSPANYKDATSIAAMAGGGLDLLLNRYISWRVIQADYVFSKFKNPADAAYSDSGAVWDSVRVQSGLVFNFGQPKAPEMVSADCTSSPKEIQAGEPVSFSMATKNFQPKRKVVYAWQATGGKVAAKDNAGTIETAGLTPGKYTISGTATDNGKGKNQQSAKCSTDFTVLAPPMHPPVIKVSANPSVVTSGDPSAITTKTSSPDNAPLTESCSPSAGSLKGGNGSYTLDTATVPSGTITVHCTVNDARRADLTASDSTTVTVNERAKAPTAATKLNAANFPDKKRPARVDNAAKQVLRDAAHALQQAPQGSKLILVGNAWAAEKKAHKNLPAERAINAKEFLLDPKNGGGVDAGSVVLYTGNEDAQTVDVYLQKPGDTFDASALTPVVEKPAVKKAVKKAAKK